MGYGSYNVLGKKKKKMKIKSVKVNLPKIGKMSKYSKIRIR